MIHCIRLRWLSNMTLFMRTCGTKSFSGQICAILNIHSCKDNWGFAGLFCYSSIWTLTKRTSFFSIRARIESSQHNWEVFTHSRLSVSYCLWASVKSAVVIVKCFSVATVTSIRLSCHVGSLNLREKSLKSPLNLIFNKVWEPCIN